MRIISLSVQPARRRVPRRAQRYPVRWAVTEINGKPAQDAWVVDVSSMGARLETTVALTPNASVKFNVSLPDGTGVMLAGRVVWMRPIFSMKGRFYQGVQFYGVNWNLDLWGRKELTKSG